MLEGKAMIEDTDMAVEMQLQAMASASQALDLYDVFDCRSIAAHIKKVFSFSLSLSQIHRKFHFLASFFLFFSYFLG